MSLTNDPQSAIATITVCIEAALIEIRCDIHAHPELAFEEVRTAGVVAAELTRLGISHQTVVSREVNPMHPAVVTPPQGHRHAAA